MNAATAAEIAAAHAGNNALAISAAPFLSAALALFAFAAAVALWQAWRTRRPPQPRPRASPWPRLFIARNGRQVRTDLPTFPR
jgi:hypothetical protein